MVLLASLCDGEKHTKRWRGGEKRWRSYGGEKVWWVREVNEERRGREGRKNRREREREGSKWGFPNASQRLIDEMGWSKGQKWANKAKIKHIWHPPVYLWLPPVVRSPSSGFSTHSGVEPVVRCLGSVLRYSKQNSPAVVQFISNSNFLPTSKCILLAVRTPNWVKFVLKLKPLKSNFQWNKPHSQIHLV